MKILLSFFVAFITMTIGLKSVASGGGGRDNNALFPAPTPIKSLSIVPGKTQLTSPVALSTVIGTQTTLTWQAVENADAYHIQFAKDPQFKWIIKEENLYKNNSLEVSGLEAGKIYFWRVAALKTDNIPGHQKGFFTQSSFNTKAQ